MERSITEPACTALLGEGEGSLSCVVYNASSKEQKFRNITFFRAGTPLVLSADAEDDSAEDEEDGGPGDGDEEAPVDGEPCDPPAPAEHAPQRLAGEGLGQQVADVPVHETL